MSEQALVQVRVDKRLREETAKLFEMMGLDLQTAIRIFLAKARREHGFPFELTLTEKELQGGETVAASSARERFWSAFEAARKQAENTSPMDDMAIEEEIRQARLGRKAREEASRT